jgi:hypothetical protein
MPWVKTGPVDWVNQDYPGYVIVQIGDSYEIHRGGRRIGCKAGNWDAAIELIENDIATL